MKKIFIPLGIAILLIISVLYFQSLKGNISTPSFLPSSKNTPTVGIKNNQEVPLTTIIAEGLDTPWGLVFLPDKSMLVTERSGRVRFVDMDGNLDVAPVATIQNAKEIGEGGLLGIALHPDFSSNHFVYLYYTFSGSGSDTLNRVVRMTYEEKKLTEEKIIVDSIPGASNHNGGRIKFGPDGFLYITTGDAQQPSQAQDTESLAGKILRVTDEGKVPSGNPFNNFVYSYGHRNPQGIAWDASGQLWETEHGPSGLETGNDELNKIEKGKNYGWPDIRGTQRREGMETPVIESGVISTWAPGSLAYVDGKLYFSGLRGETLFRFDPRTGDLKKYFENEYGRLREAIVGLDGMLYVTTSNRDGRGIPDNTDDRIIKVNAEKL